MRSASVSCIRPAQLGDIEAIQVVEVAAGQPFREVGLPDIADDDPPSAEVLTTAIENDLVRVIDGDPAVSSSVLAAWAWFCEIDGYVHIEQVSTHPDFRGHRLGTSLVNLATLIAAQRGLAGVTLTTFENVPWNAPLYKGLGFQPLPDAPLPHLRSILHEESERGLDVAPRIAMLKPLPRQ